MFLKLTKPKYVFNCTFPLTHAEWRVAVLLGPLLNAWRLEGAQLGRLQESKVRAVAAAMEGCRPL